MTHYRRSEPLLTPALPLLSSEFRAWFEEFEARLFDERIERDAEAGKIDKQAAEARANHRAGCGADF